MKNPMTPEQMKQAIDENAAGHDMQRRIIGSAAPWSDRHPDWAGEPLDFSTCEYRRKPELTVVFIHKYLDSTVGDVVYRTVADALNAKSYVEFRVIRVVEDTTWLKPKPEQEKNPWRKVIPNKTPDFTPTDLVTVAYRDGNTFTIIAGDFNWASGNAIKWRYAEDE